jgi:hypothetical protein
MRRYPSCPLSSMWTILELVEKGEEVAATQIQRPRCGAVMYIGGIAFGRDVMSYVRLWTNCCSVTSGESRQGLWNPALTMERRSLTDTCEKRRVNAQQTEAGSRVICCQGTFGVSIAVD